MAHLEGYALRDFAQFCSDGPQECSKHSQVRNKEALGGAHLSGGAGLSAAAKSSRKPDMSDGNSMDHAIKISQPAKAHHSACQDGQCARRGQNSGGPIRDQELSHWMREMDVVDTVALIEVQLNNADTAPPATLVQKDICYKIVKSSTQAANGLLSIQSVLMSSPTKGLFRMELLNSPAWERSKLAGLSSNPVAVACGRRGAVAQPTSASF